MSQELGNKVKELVDKLVQLVNQYKNAKNDQERFEIQVQIMNIRAEIELLLAQLSRV